MRVIESLINVVIDYKIDKTDKRVNQELDMEMYRYDFSLSLIENKWTKVIYKDDQGEYQVHEREYLANGTNLYTDRISFSEYMADEYIDDTELVSKFSHIFSLINRGWHQSFIEILVEENNFPKLIFISNIIASLSSALIGNTLHFGYVAVSSDKYKKLQSDLVALKLDSHKVNFSNFVDEDALFYEDDE